MKLKKFPNAEIQKVLRLSYDELDDTEKKIFLDIACFFKGHKRDEVSIVLSACGFFADIGISNLLNKALITIDSYNRIEMHDMIQEMGQGIVRGASINNLGQQSRLWDFEEVCDVLTNNRGNDAIESIVLDMSQINDLQLRSRAFSQMSNLRLLAFKNSWRSNNTVSISRDFELPRSVRFLQWDKYPLKYVPSICFMEKLVVLSMRGSNVEKLWNGVQNFPSLKKIDLCDSKRLRECPNLCGSPNLEYLSLYRCESLRHVDPSVFSLSKLQKLNLGECKALKSLCSNTCSPSLRILIARRCPNLQEFSVTLSGDHCNIFLDLRSGLNKVPSSILHLRNVDFFFFPICESLGDLPENFTRGHILLIEPNNHQRDTSTMLHIVLPSPVFQNVRVLSFLEVKTLFELPDNICMLSSLEELSLQRTSVVSLPESIKHLSRLRVLCVDDCKMLPCVPALPQSIQYFSATDCTSLKTVLSSKIEPPSEKLECTIVIYNCINLDEHACDSIVKDAIGRIEHGAKLLSAVTFEHAYSNDDDDDDGQYYFYMLDQIVNSGRICYFLPARSGGVGEYFHFCSTQASITIELLPNFKIQGFIFYFVVSSIIQSYGIKRVGCECYLEKSKGERVEVISFFMYDAKHTSRWPFMNLNSDHVCLWYDAKCCKKIMEAIEETEDINDGSTTHKPKLTFKFFCRNIWNQNVEIEECGVRWIYALEDQIVEEERVHKSKRRRETILNGDVGSESDEPEEMFLPPIKKLKQDIYVEVEDLRSSLEELLHIGFGKGFCILDLLYKSDI